jgi:hypothetical protein
MKKTAAAQTLANTNDPITPNTKSKARAKTGRDFQLTVQ